MIKKSNKWILNRQVKIINNNFSRIPKYKKEQQDLPVKTITNKEKNKEINKNSLALLLPLDYNRTWGIGR